MLTIGTFIVNAVLNFLLGLVVAGALGPAEYGRFSIAFMAAIVAGTIAFDWLRLSATRFYSQKSSLEAPQVRASLNAGYLTASALLALLAGGALALGFDLGLSPALIGAAATVAIANGLFEYHAALLRARFRNKAYSALVIVKNVLAFGSMLTIGYLYRNSAPVLAMLAVSSVLAALFVWRFSADAASIRRHFAARQIATFAHYGAPIVLANIVYQAIVLINRGEAAAQFGYASAGQLALPTDVTIRLMLSMGAALDVFLFQLAVHARTTTGEDGARAQIARNMTVITAILVLVCIGFVADMPAFAALAAPERFRPDFAKTRSHSGAGRAGLLPRPIRAQPGVSVARAHAQPVRGGARQPARRSRFVAAGSSRLWPRRLRRDSRRRVVRRLRRHGVAGAETKGLLAGAPRCGRDSARRGAGARRHVAVARYGAGLAGADWRGFGWNERLCRRAGPVRSRRFA